MGHHEAGGYGARLLSLNNTGLVVPDYYVMLQRGNDALL